MDTSFNSFPNIIKIEKSYIQTIIFFIYFQKQTIGCMKLNSIYFMFLSIGQKWCNSVQQLIIMQNYTGQLIGFPQLCRNFTNYDIIIKAFLNDLWTSAQKPKSRCRQLLVGLVGTNCILLSRNKTNVRKRPKTYLPLPLVHLVQPSIAYENHYGQSEFEFVEVYNSPS